MESDINKKLELIKLLKDLFIKDGLSDAFDDELKNFLEEIDPNDVPSNLTLFYSNYTKQETKELNDNSEYEKRIEEYQLENTSLKSKIQEIENNNKNNLYEKDKDKVKELEEKLKHYQEENVRLSNQIFNQDKKIEIMRNQISNFENLKQKLYEQVNTLGDTLLDNDNVENIFEKNSSLENFDKNEKIKIVNSTQEISESNSKYEDKNIVKTSSNIFDARNLDQDIKNIFGN